MTLKQQMARTSVDSIGQKLKRCIEALKRHVTPEGRLDDADQHAVRIMESRIRHLERLYNVHYAGPQISNAAYIELYTVKNKDDGTLVQLGEKRHGQGRLDCRACDNEEVMVDGHTVQRVASRLCTACKQGIQHSYTERNEGYSEVSPQGVGLPIPTPELNAPDTRYGGTNQGIFAIVQHKVCDNCGHDEMTLIGYEYEPKKERWRQVML